VIEVVVCLPSWRANALELAAEGVLMLLQRPWD
jgi:hypothetical protein